MASVAAVLFAFTSFSQLKTEWGHAAGVFLALFPLLVLAIVRLWERVTVGRVIVAGVVWGCLPYVDGYYLTFAALTVVGVVGGMTLSIARRGGRAAVRSITGRLVATAAAGGVALVVLMPWALVLLSDFGAIDEQTTRTGDDAGRYSARIWEFLLPSGRHPLAPEAYSTWRIEHMHRSNLAETAIYVGIVPIVLAVIGIVATRRLASRSTEEDSSPADPALSTGVDRRTVCAGLIGLVVVGVACSLNPDAELFGVPMPMPSELIRAVMPQVRVLSRLVILVTTGLVALAAVGLQSVLSRPSIMPRRVWVAAGVTAVALFESLTFAPWSPPTWSYERTPAVFVALADDDTVDTVALYPMLLAGENGDVLPTYQPELGKVVVNAVSDTGAVDDPADVTRGLASLTDPQTLPGLRMLGADVVVLTAIGTEVTTVGAVPDGLQLESTTTCAPPVLGVVARDADGRDCLPNRVYRILPGPQASAIVALDSGWGDFVADGWGGHRAAVDGAQVEVVSSEGVAGDDAEVTVSFEVWSPSGNGMVSIVDPGRSDEVVVLSAVGSAPTRIEFVTTPGRALVVRLDGLDEVVASGFATSA